MTKSLPLDPQSLTQLLRDRQHPILQRITRQAERLQAINCLLNEQLPPLLVGHCCAYHTTATQLTIGVDNACWLTQLRFLTANILIKLRRQPQFADLQKIKYQVNPPITVKPSPPSNQPSELSSSIRAHAQAAAFTIQDPALKQALLKLAATTGQK